MGNKRTQSDEDESFEVRRRPKGKIKVGRRSTHPPQGNEPFEGWTNPDHILDHNNFTLDLKEKLLRREEKLKEIMDYWDDYWVKYNKSETIRLKKKMKRKMKRKMKMKKRKLKKNNSSTKAMSLSG